MYVPINCPFMVCMSPSVMSSLIDKLANNCDTEALIWANELAKNVQVSFLMCMCAA